MRPRSGAERVLVLAHAGLVDASVACVVAQRPGVAVDVLAFGRAAGATAPPSGATLLEPPALGHGRLTDLSSAARFAFRVWRRRHARAVVVLADLGVNQSRGALLGVALASGARHAVAIDPSTGSETRPFGRGALAADAMRFVAFHALGFALSAAARVAMGALTNRRRVAPPAPEPARSGRAIYLRTDIELSWAPLLAGGSLAHTIGILRAIRRRGHDVVLLTTGEMAGVAGEATETRLPVVLRGNVPRELCELLAGIRQGLVRVPRGEKPVFIYQRHSMNNVAGVVLARRLGVPLILEANASEVQWREEWSSLRLPGLGRACERLILGDAARIAAVSENAADHLRDAGAPADRLRVIPNAVEVTRFTSVSARRLNWGDEAFVVGFAGLFYPRHGVRYLAEAFPLVVRERPAARLLLVGDGEDAPLARQLLESAGVMDKVLLTGLVPADDVPGYLLAADVLASPHAANDRFIGSPIKLWEYMACGRAIVASSVAQLGEVIQHEQTGLLVPPRDIEALASAIVRLHDDPALRAALGQAAQAEAIERHSWDARLKATLVD